MNTGIGKGKTFFFQGTVRRLVSLRQRDHMAGAGPHPRIRMNSKS